MDWINKLFETPGAVIRKYSKTYLLLCWIFMFINMLAGSVFILATGSSVYDLDLITIFLLIIATIIVSIVLFFVEVIPTVLLFSMGKLSDDVADIKIMISSENFSYSGKGDADTHYAEEIARKAKEEAERKAKEEAERMAREENERKIAEEKNRRDRVESYWQEHNFEKEALLAKKAEAERSLGQLKNFAGKEKTQLKELIAAIDYELSKDR